MDSSFPEKGSDAQEQAKSSFMSLRSPVSIIRWLARLITLTEEEQENAGIHLDRLGDE